MSEWESDLPCDDFIPESTITVILACDKTRIDEDQVEFVDISEDIEGRDVLRFVCPKCGQMHDSLRYG
jgi:ribosomal protein L7Ae-like RNA K-turn-binding protein